MIRFSKCPTHYPGYNHTSYNLDVDLLPIRRTVNLSLHTYTKGMNGGRVEIRVTRKFKTIDEALEYSKAHPIKLGPSVIDLTSVDGL